MLKEIKWKVNNLPKGDKENCIKFLNEEEITKVRNFHKSFPQYKETPLANLEGLAKKLGVAGVYVKDESYRFGLNAFKVLGGSYSMGKYLAQRLDTDISELGYEKLISKEIKEQLGEITFFTATDGNHGRGVAWTANKLGQKSVVLMPKGSSEFRLNKIKGEGADASITDLNYDDAVRLANDYAEADDHGVMVQDTAWDGYEEIPAWIMQGYGTMAQEAIEQLKEYGVDRPTHVFVQAGVGSLAGAVQGYVASIYDECPITVVVEADEADCYYKSAEAGDGKPRFVGGDMPTIMAGLACGEPNTIGFEVLKNHAAAFVSAPDWVSAKGMRTLGNPLNGDEKVISGESGAVTTGLLIAAMEREDLADLRRDLKLDENSRILLISTEGDTDPDKYRSIVWDGEYPSI
ncbi:MULTISPECIES: diaminopropionate ammonia-lyase [unclassified Clostridioides]|uniref:diaminopropionate ammonia-lyase n=1 Tax=unclassified Clostridioides TaxID=2635829 RepID=UPI001D0FC408|nr:diaminopropionate ammonia-lyase [Clostridioides sp. ZZV15-6388]MCC0643393.1 diaminopropionate ammonia-lyase [Clostridioides sp. ZZV14-6150]MCC0658778.1 diaminopropionate ammonia-lyase [Clostridioides sp. ZZV14-6154]MCC0664764.1 diaminopropionate ammonia-lyase [Clostridioides sp. ZZV15-6597]MCC0668751.1 diaminopropionate ammonia-lyase [Clostridioides sp. ZZV14-6153]MCC0718523.1 diaminopropionate ammonia-lyase [Clostridioides sp. ZZV14-6105]MCC0721773.1 diaminopropionate ammonia-lyase [Clost